MNIWCISKYASPSSYSRMPARLFSLTKEFINLGHNAILFTSDSNHLAEFPNTNKIYNYEIIDTVPTYWIKTKKYVKTASLSRILSWFDFERKLFGLNTKNIIIPDVVLISSLSLLSIVYGYYLKRKYKAFLVFEIRDIWPLTMTEEAGFSKWHPLVLFLGFIEKFGYRVANLIVGTMPKLDLHVKDILGYEKKFYCSPLGFNSRNYHEDINKSKNIFSSKFPKNKKIVGYAGSMGITNSLEPFIETIKLMAKDDNIYFVLVGSGDLKLQYMKELDNCNNVMFMDRISQDEVKYFLFNCDILYLSTKHSKVWNYGQSMNKVVEYMLASKPIIASYSGYPSMINEANCGKFINTEKAEDIKSAIVEILSLSDEDIRKLGANGKEWVWENRQYSFLAKRYIEQMERLND